MELLDLFGGVVSNPRARKGWVLVQAQNPELKTKMGGIIINHDSVAHIRWGEVLSVGPDVSDVEVGDMVGWPEFTGHKHQEHNHTFWLRDEELVGAADAVLDPLVDEAETHEGSA